MTILNPSQLEQIRTHPQQTKLHLSMFTPSTVMACQITGSPSKGDRTLSYYAVSTGTFSNIESGMTLLVGSSPGAFDLGRIRIKSATSTQIVVSENSSIDWSFNNYLTVIKFWDVWPVYPRIIPDPSNSENVIFYKDYDIPYSNQNSILGTFVCSGPHRAKYLDGGQAQIHYSSSGTFNPVLGGSVGHFWEFEGGTPSTYAGPEPGAVSYASPGHYVTKHIVTGSNGCSDTSYRYVSIYQRPDSGPNTTIQDFTIESLDGSRDSGGYSSRIKIHQQLVNPIIPGTIVVVFAETMYGATNINLGGNSINNESIVFVGHVLEGSVIYSYEDSEVEFEVGSITELMKLAEGFSVSVEDSTNPDVWYKLLGLDCRRAIYHYLRWHSTVLSLADFQFVGTDYPIQFFDADRESLYDAINNFITSTLVGELTADRQGKLWAEVAARATPSTIVASGMSITDRDWVGEPSIQELVNEKTSYLELGGIAYSGSVTGTFSALMACAPGAAPAFRGSADRSQGLALGSQTQLNQMVGNILANKNYRFPDIDLLMAGSYLNIDIAPQQSYLLNLVPDDTVRNIYITGSYIAQAVSWEFDGENQFLQSRVGWRCVTSGPAGETIPIPPTPPNGGFSAPPIRIPVLGPVPMPVLLSQSSYLVLRPIDSAQTPGGTNPIQFVLVTSSGAFVLSTGTAGPTSVSGSLINAASDGIYLISFFGSTEFSSEPGFGASVELHYVDTIDAHVVYDRPSRDGQIDQKDMLFNMSCVAIGNFSNLTAHILGNPTSHIMDADNSFLIIVKL